MRSEYDFSAAKRGAVIEPSGKTRITIMLDDEVINAFRAQAEQSGTGYQTEINRALREHLGEHAEPLTIEAMRRVLREELGAAA